MNPSKNIKADHFRPTSKMPFKDTSQDEASLIQTQATNIQMPILQPQKISKGMVKHASW